MSKIHSIEPLSFPWQTQDPFLFCAYHKDEYPAGNNQMGVEFEQLRGRNVGQDFVIKDGYRMYHGRTVPGFPYHPHRGFETITINMEGIVDHSDSMGAAGRFMSGDVQWMTAGSGVQHSEMFPLVNDSEGNTLEIFQIWLNLPKSSKMVEPHFKMLWREEIPVIHHLDKNDNKTTIKIIAGGIGDTRAASTTPDSWAANPDNAVGVFTIHLDPNAEWILPRTVAGANRSVYYYKGQGINLDGTTITSDHRVRLQSDVDTHIKNGTEESFLLVLEGKPINEPVVKHGPFVMNTQAEIEQTFRDYQKSQFGGWPWPETEVVHPRNKGRFALHSNGIEEIK